MTRKRFMPLLILIGMLVMPTFIALAQGTPAIKLENPDWTTLFAADTKAPAELSYLNEWISFSRVRNDTSNSGGTLLQHEVAYLRIRNTGSANLVVNSLTLSNTADFRINNAPALPLTITPNTSVNIELQFIKNDGYLHYRKVVFGDLTIGSNDPANPTKIAKLAGAYMWADEGREEVTAAQIAETFGFTMDFGNVTYDNKDPDQPFLTLSSQYYDKNLSDPPNKENEAGDEHYSFRWKRADSSKPVYVRQIAAYHGCCTDGQKGWFNITETGGGRFDHEGKWGQSIFPRLYNDQPTPAEKLYPNASTTSFALQSSGFSSDACRNDILGCNTSGIRLWPVLGPNGILVPNTYFMIQDYVGNGCNGGSNNCDYNDNLFLITNLAPVDPMIDLKAEIKVTWDPPHGSPQLNRDFNIQVTGKNLVYYPSENTTMKITVAPEVTIKSISLPPAKGTCTSAFDATTGTTIDCTLNPLWRKDPAVVNLVANSTIRTTGSIRYKVAAEINNTRKETVPYDVMSTNNKTETTFPVNNTPPTAVNDSYPATEDTVLNIAAPGVLANDSDYNYHAVRATVNNTPLTITTVEGGTTVLRRDGSFTYTPKANFSGTDSFEFLVFDELGSTKLSKVTFQVAPVQDAPLVANETYTTPEDTVLTVDAATGVLANDTDPDGTPLIAALKTQATLGTVQLAADGSFVYTPNLNAIGNDSFVYTVSDGTATVDGTATIVIDTPGEDVPVVVNDAYSTNEDQPLNVPALGVLENDTDPDADKTLTAELVDDVTNGILQLEADGSFTYTPNVNFNGTDTFTYNAVDVTDRKTLATVTITVNALNDLPVVQNENYQTPEDTTLTIPAPGVLTNDSDADGNLLNVVVKTLPTLGTLTLSADGGFEYVPNPNANGTDTFVYTVSDGTATVDGTATITITAVEDAPVVLNDEYQTQEDTPLTVAAATGVLANDTDPDANKTLTAELVTNVTNGTLQFEANGGFTYTPAAGFTGAVTFTYNAVDVTDRKTLATVEIEVGNVNDVPVAVDDNYSINEGATLNVPAAGVLMNDTDADGDTLTVIANTQPTMGTLQLAANGGFVYIPNQVGTDSFTYTIGDGNGGNAQATVTITINDVNVAPVAVNDNYSTLVNTPLTVPVSGVLANDTDGDGDTLTAALAIQPTLGTVQVNSNGSFTYTPNADVTGTDSFTYTAQDGNGGTDSATVSIAINSSTPTNNAPVVVNDIYTTAVNTTLTIAAPGVLTNDSDPNGDVLVAALAAPPMNGTAMVNADGSFSYTPTAAFLGTDSFGYNVADGKGGFASGTVTVNVTSDGTPPDGDPNQLVLNAGFEVPTGARGKSPDAWKPSKLSGDKLKGNKPGKTIAKAGNYAFMFRGSAGENSKLVQVVDATRVLPGDTLTLSAWIKGKKVKGKDVKVIAKIKMAEGGKRNLKLAVKKGTYDYTQFTSQTTAVNGTPRQIKVIVGYGGKKGKFFIDNVYLVRNNAPVLEDAVETLPVEGFNGLNLSR